MLLRTVWILLIAMNLGAAAWWLWHAPVVTPQLAVGKPGIPQLVLLSETEAAAAPAGELDAAPTPLSATPRCLSLGPLQTQADLRRVMNALTPHAGRIQYRETRATQIRGYRVYLPAFPSREAALSTARELAAKGMRDYYVVTAGQQQNTVSLGLFRDLANAQTRREEVRQLGFEPTLEPRSEEVQNYWVDLAVSVEFDWRQALGGYAGLESRDIDCF